MAGASDSSHGVFGSTDATDKAATVGASFGSSSGVHGFSSNGLRDNGSGKTQRCVRFNSGAVKVLATQS